MLNLIHTESYTNIESYKYPVSYNYAIIMHKANMEAVVLKSGVLHTCERRINRNSLSLNELSLKSFASV